MSRTERGLAVLLWAAVLAVAAVRLRGGHFEWMLWSDRDLVRSSGISSSWPTTGPELSHGVGARLPGGAYHLLLALPLAVSSEPVVVWRWQALLDTCGMLALALSVARLGGPLAGAATACAWLTSEGLDDSVAKLWNPGFLPAFLGLATAAWVRAVGEGRGAALAVTGVALGVATQQHVSALLTGFTLLPAVLAVRPPGWARGLGLGSAGFVATYLPYLADEAARGWPNTRALLAQRLEVPWQASCVARSGSAWMRGLVVDPSRPVPGLGPVAGWIGLASGVVVGLGVGLAVVRAFRRPGETERVVLGAASALGLSLAIVVADCRLDAQVLGGFRYLLFAVPTFAACVGLAAAGPTRVLLVPALAAAALLTGVRHAVVAPPSQRELLDTLRAATGWSLVELAGRTALPGGSTERPTLHGDAGIDWLLAREGATFPGSASPPCLLVADEHRVAKLGRTARIDSGAVAALLGRPPEVASAITVLDQEASGARVLVRYAIAGERCATVLVNRYLPTADELEAWEAISGLAGNVAVDRRDGRPGVRAAVRVEVPSAWPGLAPEVLSALVEVRGGTGSAAVRLVSNQLRGRAFNDGFFRVHHVDSPRIVLSGEGGVVEVPITSGLVGDQRQLTPLDASAPVPPGRWRATLVGAVLAGVKDASEPLDPLPRAPFSVPLPGEVEVR